MNRCQFRSLAMICLSVFCLATVAMAGDGSNDIHSVTDTDLLVEGFEGVAFPPLGWHKIHLGNTYSWSVTTLTSNTGAKSAYIRDGSPGNLQDEYLVMPALNFFTQGSVFIEWYEDESNWSSRGGTHYVMVSTTSQTDPETFEVVAEMTPDTHDIPGFGNEPIVVDLSAYGGQSTVYVALRYVGDDADYWYVDDIRVYGVAAGRDVFPTNLLPADQHYDAGEMINPIATFLNNGGDPETYDVILEILESGTSVYSETMSIVDHVSGGYRTVNFPAHTVAAGKLIELKVTSLLEDDVPANNTMYRYNESWTGAHIPLGILFTNAGCGPCVSANQAMDNYMPGQGNDVALIRIHVSWPGADIMYSANPGQSNYMVSDYGVSGVPDFFMDGGDANPNSNSFEQAKLKNSPTSIGLEFNDDTDQLTVDVHNFEMMIPANNLKLRVVITEDNIAYQGTNGEPIHSQAMRYFFPDVYGLDVPSAIGHHEFVVDTPLNAGWVYENLRATVYIQNMDNRVVYEAGTDFLSNIDDGVAPVGDEIVSPFKLSANYPNPFNPNTTISFSLPHQEQVELAIFAVDGSRVATLVSETMGAGDHQVVWTGRNELGAAVASGAYFYRLTAGNFTQTRQMTLIK